MLKCYWLVFEPEHGTHFTHSSISGFSSVVGTMGEFVGCVVEIYLRSSLDAKCVIIMETCI